MPARTGAADQPETATWQGLRIFGTGLRSDCATARPQQRPSAVFWRHRANGLWSDARHQGAERQPRDRAGHRNGGWSIRP